MDEAFHYRLNRQGTNPAVTCVHKTAFHKWQQIFWYGRKRCGTIACGKGYNLEGVHEKSQPFLYDGGCQINVLPACSILFDCYNRTLFIKCPGKTKVIEKGDSPACSILHYAIFFHQSGNGWKLFLRVKLPAVDYADDGH